SAGSVLIFYGEPLRLFLSLVIAAGGGFKSWLFFGYSYISFTVGFFAALIISSVIIEIIFSADFGAALKHKRWLGASVLTGAVILIYTFSGLYDSYLPKASLIKEAAFYIDEIHYDELITTKEDKNYLVDNADETFMKDYNGETVFSYISDDDILTTFRREKYTDYVFKNMKITDGELAEKVLSACVKRYREKNGVYSNNAVSISVKCKLKSGRSYTRRYIVNIDDCREALGELFASEEYKKSFYESFYNLENEDIKALKIDNSFCWHGEQRVNNITEEQWQRLYAAVCEDTANLTFEEVITDVPLCAVSFYTRETGSGFYEDYFEGAMMYIYPSYEKTIECLKEVGFKTYTADELAEHITRINNITDKGFIKEILPYMFENHGLHRTEILYPSLKESYPSVYTKDSQNDDDYYTGRYFKEYSELPESIRNYFIE
ncbi:MAG: DUF6449 domain-containing protein, partial [Eubacterium sp.]|nr:DUF6449 domain-containing protein [Eubacterium sp.]